MESGSDSRHVFMVLFLHRQGRKDLFISVALEAMVCQVKLSHAETLALVQMHTYCVGAHNLISPTESLSFFNLHCTFAIQLILCENELQKHIFMGATPPWKLGLGLVGLIFVCVFKMKIGSA